MYVVPTLVVCLLDIFLRTMPCRGAPDVRFMADDGVEHMVWPVRDSAEVFSVQRAFESVNTTYIADGHHRSASAFRCGLFTACGVISYFQFQILILEIGLFTPCGVISHLGFRY